MAFDLHSISILVAGSFLIPIALLFLEYELRGFEFPFLALFKILFGVGLVTFVASRFKFVVFKWSNRSLRFERLIFLMSFYGVIISAVFGLYSIPVKSLALISVSNALFAALWNFHGILDILNVAAMIGLNVIFGIGATSLMNYMGIAWSIAFAVFSFLLVLSVKQMGDLNEGFSLLMVSTVFTAPVFGLLHYTLIGFEDFSLHSLHSTISILLISSCLLLWIKFAHAKYAGNSEFFLDMNAALLFAEFVTFVWDNSFDETMLVSIVGVTALLALRKTGKASLYSVLGLAALIFILTLVVQPTPASPSYAFHKLSNVEKLSQPSIYPSNFEAFDGSNISSIEHLEMNYLDIMKGKENCKMTDYMKICDKHVKCVTPVEYDRKTISKEMRDLTQKTMDRMMRKAWGDHHPHIDLFVRAGCVR